MKNKIEDLLKSEIEQPISGISKKTVRNIIQEWHKTGESLYKINKDLPDKDAVFVCKLIGDCISKASGEISRHTKLLHLAITYLQLSKIGKEHFFKLLINEFDVDLALLNDKIKLHQNAENVEERILAELNLREILIPPRILFLRQLMSLPNGFIFIKDMRQDFIPMIKSNPKFKKLDNDFKNILIAYFDVNLLDLAEITWDSSAALLERLAKYEAVHKITSWHELKHRLSTNHRVYGFFHYRMPNDPLIFIEVAFVKGMANNIQKIINVDSENEDVNDGDTAIFYSISNTQQGLKGISFGNFLIKQVVRKITDEYPNVKNFATLSPIPLFRRWLHNYLTSGGDNLFTNKEAAKFCKQLNTEDVSQKLLEIITQENWFQDEAVCRVIKKPLMRLCAHYLMNIKRKNSNSAYDPVANFHLSNGAKIRHLHWLGDTSDNGMKQSAGMMLNYHYVLDKIIKNHESYKTNGTIQVAKEIKKLL